MTTDAVYQWMTPLPFSIRRDETLAKAAGLFEQHGIRHLPVVDGETLVGLITERDVHLAEVFGGRRSMKIEVVMSTDPYVVHPMTPLAEVALTMVKGREDAALVVEGGRVAGVFTSVDALRAIAGARKIP